MPWEEESKQSRSSEYFKGCFQILVWLNLFMSSTGSASHTLKLLSAAFVAQKWTFSIIHMPTEI